MSAIPSNISRVPDVLATRLSLTNLQKGGVDLLNITEQLSTGKRINRPSDSPIEASLISGLRSRLNASDQRLRNLDFANGALSTMDQSLGEAADILRQALSIGSSQIGSGSDAETRASQAAVIESMLREVQTLSQAQYGDMYVFGGNRTGLNPVQTFLDGYRHVGSGDGLRTELGGQLDIPITLGAERAFGSLSTRIEGVVDLNPLLQRATELTDLRGARTLGVSNGSIDVTVDDGTTPVTLQVDLTSAKNMGDVLDAIESAIRTEDAGALQGGFPGGIDVSPFGDRVLVQANVGYTITFADSGGGTTAADLGLDSFTYNAGATENTAIDLDPVLTHRTQFSALNPVGGFAAGDIVLTNGGRTGTVTVLPSMRVSDFVQQVEALGLGLRVEVDSVSRGLQVVNEVSGWNMTVEESGAGTYTATSLGIRSVQGATPGSVFNNGRGVEIAHGNFDPLTGLADPDRNTDFRITLSDGSTFDVDLTPADIQDVTGILNAINAAAATATPSALTPAEFEARLGDGDNGIVLIDNTGGAASVTVESLNGFAAEDLGLLDGQFTPAGGGNPATYTGEDRAKVRVGSVFSALTELRTALEGNDVRGISFATDELQSHLERLVSARAIVGGRGQRVEEAKAREEDRQLLDNTVISGLEDTDFAEASTRFSLLELTQQATYAATSRLQSLSLLNFLG